MCTLGFRDGTIRKDIADGLKRELQISSKFAMRNFSNIRHRSFE